MKKSKLLVTSLAVLTFSTVSAVTSTVAWFTSASAVKVSTTSFQVTGLDGSLSVSYEGGVGTTVNADGDAIIPADNGLTGDNKVTANLTHGSFDHTTKKVYTKDQETEGYKECGVVGTSADSAFLEDASKLKYNCFTWTLTVKYMATDAKGPTDANRNLYFDTSVAKIGLDTANKLVATKANAGRAFRIAFLSDDTSASPLVWSPESGTVYSVNATPSSTEKTASSYVSGTGSTNVTNYTTTKTGNLYYKNDKTISLIQGGTEGETGRKDYLGAFTSTNGWIVITCVAWFEGLDTLNVNNDTTKPSVDAEFGFYVRKAASAS